MSRQGWALRQRTKGGVFYVRCFISGQEPERTTGTRDRREATRKAPSIYAAVVSEHERGGGRRGVVKSTDKAALSRLFGQWLAALKNTHAAGTLATWEGYAGAHWLRFFYALPTDESVTEYMRERLGHVLAATVKHEFTALRSFCAWLEVHVPGYSAPSFPKLPKRAIGTPYKYRRRASSVPISVEHVAAFLAELPDWSASKKVARFPIRARFVVAYQTSLRPSTLDRIETPKHYRKGENRLRLTADTDKVRWSRDIPLTEEARRALDEVLDELGAGYEGPIFGRHDYREQVKKAALVVPAEIRDRFIAAHLRSAAITHMLGANVPLADVQYMAGQRLVGTTARYVKPSFESAARSICGEQDPNKRPKR
jgi:integrase